MEEMPGLVFVYALDRFLVLFIGKFTPFIKKFLERKVLPVSGAVLGELLPEMQMWMELYTLGLVVVC